MAIYSIAQRSTVTTIAAAAWELRSSSTNKTRVFELGIFNGAATASVYGVGRPAAIGITPTSPLTILDEQDGGGPTGLATCAVAWGTPPTVPSNFFRRCSIPATIGAAMIFSFPRGLGLPISSSIVMWNITANTAVVDFHAVCDE